MQSRKIYQPTAAGETSAPPTEKTALQFLRNHVEQIPNFGTCSRPSSSESLPAHKEVQTTLKIKD